MEKAAASASKGLPSLNVTPARMANVHSVSVVCSH